MNTSKFLKTLYIAGGIAGFLLTICWVAISAHPSEYMRPPIWQTEYFFYTALYYTFNSIILMTIGIFLSQKFTKFFAIVLLVSVFASFFILDPKTSNTLFFYTVILGTFAAPFLSGFVLVPLFLGGVLCSGVNALLSFSQRTS